MKTSVNQQFAGLYSAVARLCAGLVSSAARYRGAGLALAVMKTTAIRNRCLKLGLGLFLIVATAIAAQAQYTYTELQITGNPTTPKGIAGNQIVGAYQTVGFIYDGTGYVTPDKPFGATSFHFSGLSGNTAVGTYTTAGLSHGFTYDLVSSTFTPQPKPSGDSFMEYVNGISGNLIVGYYIDNLGGQHGFLYDGTNYTGMSHPQGVNGTLPYGISDGNIVGDYTDASWKNHGFLCNIATGVYTTLDHPSGTSGTFPRGISGNLMVGNYKDSSWVYHGFVYNLSTGTFTTVDHASNDNDNRINGISSGVLVGFYQDSSSVSHGFVAVPAAAASTTTTLAANLNPSTVGASVTFTATVSPSAATGTVTFKDGATTLGTGTLSGGTATYTTAALSLGSHSLTAEYAGDSGYLGSTNSPALAQTVNPPLPTATTLAATTILGTAATLNGSINPGGYADAFFQYGTSTNTGPVVSTLVGSTYGYVDGSAAVALMKRPQLLAVDAGGNIYFVDQDVSAIRKVAPDGSVSTLAGSATSGFVNGSGSAASFSTPWGVAVGAAGTVYVADTYNKSIRKITAGGAVTTLAGNGTAGFADGTGTAARFNYPIGIAVGPGGNIYVAERYNHSIRKVTPAGVVTTLAGNGTAGFADGTGAGASFNEPFGLAVDGATNVYVADAINNRIRQVTPAGVVTTLAGSGSAGFADGQGTAAQFNYPYGVAVDTSGNLFVGDVLNGRIRKITPGGGVTTFAGSSIAGYRDGPALQARFDRPNGVALDAAGNLYVADQNNYRIRKIAAPPALVLALAQSGLTGTNPVPASLSVTGLLPGTTYYFQSVATNTAGTASGSFLSFTTPSTNASLAALALSGGTLAPAFASNTVSYTASVPNATTSITVTPTVAQANATVTVNGTSVTSGTASGPVSLVVGLNPITVVVTAQDGVTTNGYTVAVTRLPQAPTATTLAATGVLGTAATLNGSINPGGLADALFEYGTSTNEGMVVTTFAGSAAGGFADGTGVAAKFNWPRGLAVDASGNFYVADQQNHCIRKVTPAGVVTTLAGSGTSGFADGPGAAAKFSNPQGVAVDASGNVYVLDGDGLRIRKVTPAGDVSTLAGDGTKGFVNGAGATAQFSNANGIAVDGSGDVYVSDTGNQRIRKVTPAGVVTTFAGSGTAGFANGAGATAQFYNPFGVAVDASGNIYVSDTFNYRVRKVTRWGDVSTLAGSGAQGFADGPGATAQFDYLVGIVVDASGNVYVCDKNYNGVRKVTPLGDVTTLAGSGTAGFADGPVATARFNLPLGVAVDTSGNVYVADTFNNRIRKIALAVLPVVLAQAGLTGTNPVPVSLAVTGLLPETTYYYRAVAANTAGTNYGEFLTFTTLSTDATLAGLALSEGTLAPAFASNTVSYTASVPNATTSITVTPTVAQANATVTVNGTAVTSGTASGPVSLVVGLNPITVAVTAQDGVTTNGYTVAVTRLPQAPTATTLAATTILGTAATLHSRINPGGYADAFFQYGTSTNPGVVASTFAGSTRGFSNAVGTAAQFNNPQRIAVNASGNIYVADVNNHRIRIVTPAGVVTTLAGSGTGGFADGPAATAQFYNPAGVAVAANGNVYVADKNNHRIRIVTPAGVVTTLAGSSTSGFADGTGAGAKFNYPSDVAVDSSTNVYVADASNNRIRKVTPGGVVTTLAGDGASAFADGTGAAASFDGPAGVAVDASGNIYVADQWNNRIRQVTPAGVVTTLAGTNSSGFADGTGAAARFNWPVGVAVDASGNVCVADYLNHRIRMVSAAGVVTTLAGSTGGFADGPAATAKFNSPAGVAVDASGMVYVGDSNNDRIRKLAQGSLLLLLAQSGLAGTNPVPASLSVTGLLPETTYYFQSVATNLAGTAYGDFLSFTTLSTNASLSGLALSSGTLAPAFAANTVSYTATVPNATTSLTVTPTVAQTNATVTVNGTSVTSGTASGPVSLAVGLNTITVVVTAQDGVTTNGYTVAVTRLAQAPDVTTLAATGIASNAVVLNATFNPHDSTTTAFFQYGTSTNTGLVVTRLAGHRLGGFADGTGAAARFEAPNGVALDADGNIYVADTSNHRIRKVTPAGVVTTLAGTNTFGVADGTGAAAQFNSLQGVAVGPDGNIYVADTGNNRIRKVTPAGVVTTVAGTGTSGFVDGPGATAQFSWPYGVAVDANTNIYVADYNNNRIRKVAPDGTVATLAGSSMGYLDGTGTGAKFGLPAGVAVDASGNVYVADLGNQRIRKVTPAGVVTTLAGSGTSGFADGPAASAQFQWPSGVAVDASGNVYVGDPDNKRIRKLTPAGVVTTLAGSGTAGFADGPTATATFRTPKGVAVDASGAVYVGDTGNSLIRKIAMSTLPVVFAQSDIGGTSPTPVSLSVSNLVPETVYYFRGVGTNVAGTSYGAFLSFQTLAINRAPVLVTPITNQPAMFNLAFSLTFPEGTFVDPDGNALSYTATGLPPGILFDGPTHTFAGTPTAAGSYSVALVASDGQVPPLSATNSFAINVAKAPASVALSALSQTYTGTNLAITTATTPSNLTVVVTYNGTTNRPIPAASYPVIGTVDDPNYAGSTTNTLVVSPAALSVTANPQTRQYGAQNPPLTVSYNGFVNSETPAVLTTLPGCITPATSASLVGPYIITPSGGVASNYTLSYFTGTLSVTKAPLLVVGDPANRPYGHTNPVFTAVMTGVTNSDNITVTFSTTATNTSPPGDYKIALIMVDPAGKLGQYDLRLRSAYLTVTPGPLTGAVASVSRPYGGTNPVFAVNYTGFQNGDSTNVLSGELGYACTDTNGVPVNTNTPVGVYPLRVTSGQTATNYAVSYVEGTLTITPAELTVTADSPNRVYGAANPALTGTVVGQVNDDNLTASFATVATLPTPVGGYNILPVWADPDGKLGNYTVTTNLGTLTITNALLTVNVASHSRAYGASNPPLTGTVTGVLNGDNLGVGYATAATAASPVGGYPIVPTFGDPDGRLGNYFVSTNAGTLTVTNAILLGTVAAKTRGYGAANPPFTLTYSGFQNGDSTNVLSGPLAFSCVDSNTSLPVTTNTPVGGYAVSVMTSQTAANYDVQYLSGTLTVTQAVLTVTANNTNRLYGAENPAFTASYSGWQNGEGTEVLGGSLEFACPATTNSPVGSYTITSSGLTAVNYSLNYVAGSLAVGKATLLVAADDKSRLYGQTNPVFTASYTGFLNGDSASAFSGEPVLASLAESNSPVDQYPITAALGTLTATNYTFAFTNGTLSVTLQELLVRANDASRGYGAPNPAFGVAYSGFVNGETEAVLGGSLSVTSSAATNSSVGAYAIVPTGLTSTNYALTFTNGTLTVTQAVLTVTASHTNRLYGAENPAFTASYSGWQNGESSAVLGSPLTLTCAADANSPVGAYGITPAGLTALNYSFNYGNGVLTVAPATLLVAADHQTRLYGRTNPGFTASYSGFVNGDSTNVLSGTPALATQAETNSPVGQYDLTVAQGTLIATNYTFAFTNGTLTVTAQELGVTAADASRTYGATNPLFTVSYTGFVNGDTAAVLGGSLSVTSSATTNSPVGTDAIVPAGLTSTNYALSYTNGTLTVTPADLTVTVDDLRRGYGQTNPPLTGTLTGVVNDDNVTASYTTPATILSSAGNYLISPAWADPASKLGNYEVTTNLGLLTVTQAVLTVTADDQTRPYGQPNPPLTLTYSGFVNGDTVASLTTAPTGTTAATGGSLLGGFPIVPAGGVAANYTFVYVNGTLTVTKAPLFVLGDDDARPYGQTNPVFTAALAGLLAGDNISPVFFCSATTSSSLGRYDIDIWLDDPDGKLGYYDVFMLGGQLTVTNALLTGTVASQTRAYGQPNAPFTLDYTGFVNPADSNLLQGTLTLASTNGVGATVTTNTPVGYYAIRVVSRQTLTNYTVQYVTGTLSITQAVLTVTANNTNRLYGAENPAFAASYTGWQNGEGTAVLGGSLQFACPATDTSPVGSYTITPSGLTAGNYSLNYVTGSLAVSPATLLVTAEDKSRLYGQTNPVFTASYTGFLNGDSASVLSGAPALAALATTNNPVGQYPITAALGTLTATNYNFAFTNGTLSVTMQELLVRADDESRGYGATNPVFAVTYTGFVNGDTEASLGGSLNVSTSADTNSPVGTCDIAPSGLTSTNYAITFTNGTLTVTQALMVVTADNQNRLYGATNPSLTGTLVGVMNADAITATFATIATTASGVGGYAIEPVWSDPSSRLGNYTVTTNQGTLTISPAGLTVTADAQSRLYGSTNPPLPLSYVGFVNGEDASTLTTTPTASTLAVTGSPIGGYAITISGGSAANYTLQRVDGTLSVTPAPLSITASNAVRGWGTTNPVFTGTIAGPRNADVITASYTCAADISAAVGTYPILPSLDDPSGVATNYAVALSNGVLTVTFDGGNPITLSQTPWLYTVGLDPLLLEFYGLEYKLADTNAVVAETGVTNWAGGYLAVDLSANGNEADRWVVLPEGSGAGQIGLTDDTVSYSGVVFGTLSGGTNNQPLQCELNAQATPAALQALLRRVAFASLDETTNSRTMRVVLVDGMGGASLPATRFLGINRSPWTVDEHVTVRQDVNTSLSIAWMLENDSDADNDPITLTDHSLVSANGGRIVRSGTNLVYRPAAGFVGQDVFGYLVMDGRGGESPGLIWINVLRQNTLRLDPASLQDGSPGALIQFTGLPGRSYSIEVSADLANWTRLATTVANAEGIVEFVDPVRTAPRRFYRAMHQ